MIAPAYAVAAAVLLLTAGVSGGVGLLLGYGAVRVRIGALKATIRRLVRQRDDARGELAATGHGDGLTCDTCDCAHRGGRP